MLEETMAAAERTMNLHAVLDAIGATPATGATLLDGLDEDALHAAAPGGQACLNLLHAFVRASQRLGPVANDVLGHAPTRSEAVDLLREDEVLLTALRQVAATARSAEAGTT